MHFRPNQSELAKQKYFSFQKMNFLDQNLKLDYLDILTDTKNQSSIGLNHTAICLANNANNLILYT